MHEPPSISALLEELNVFGLSVERQLTSKEIDWAWRPSFDEWSLIEVMCHLRDDEKEVHQVRFAKLLASEHVFLSGENPDAWVEARQYRLEDGPSALSEFLAERHKTLALLQGIHDEATWERTSRHALFGITTLRELVNLAVRHDRAHWAQIIALTV